MKGIHKQKDAQLGEQLLEKQILKIIKDIYSLIKWYQFLSI